MTIDVDSLRKQLCSAFCEDVRVTARKDSVRVSLPLVARDGDHHTVYLSRGDGGWRISDMGTTFMRLSYESDLNSILSGPRGRLFQQIIGESGVNENDGELFVEVPADGLLRGLFSLGQCASRIEDLGLWSRPRVESTFRDDLRSILHEIIGQAEVAEDYIVPGIEDAELYPVDFSIKKIGRPLYLFGVNTPDRARISTIVMQHLIQQNHDFDSFVVCSDFFSLPKADGARLMNAANDMVHSLDNVADLRRKLHHRIA
ncbi:DUF1828 domain-containing protein [Halomonas salipaludis]|uniref:DUF1828 domain-containing protein n=1 Tax=Halomonas salipaludis TaxID=2032625 RepID=A0A2A2F199_9GAMM|nr:DUF1828 domain-containing protein [Halomonas salipaludis]PAU79196.1 hypothetical protein CK498_02170 [Halomonas salipaludis]